MKIFKLDIVSYHKLEQSHKVSIDKDGYFVRPHISRVKYFIGLGNDGYWYFSEYSSERDGFDNFILKRKKSHCWIRPNFKLVTSFNYRKKA